MNAILDKITLDDLPPNLKQIADVVGISVIKELIVKCPGVQVYIPNSIRTFVNKKYVRDNFTGANYGEISDHLGITVRSVRRLLS